MRLDSEPLEAPAQAAKPATPSRTVHGQRSDTRTQAKPALRKPFFRRPKTCPLSGANAPRIDYKDPKLLARFMSETGKILPSKTTAVCAKKQRELAVAIKNARFLGLLPYHER